MANQLTLTNQSLTTSTAVKLLNGEFSYSWKNLTTNNPVVNSYGNSEPVFTGWENPILNLTFYIPINNVPSGTMSWSLWNEFAKVRSDNSVSSTLTKLSVTVGDSDVVFADYSASSAATATTSIPVSVKSYSLRFDPGESVNASLWVINAQLEVIG